MTPNALLACLTEAQVTNPVPSTTPNKRGDFAQKSCILIG